MIQLSSISQPLPHEGPPWLRSEQQRDGAAPATINRGLSTLRRLCAWAVEQLFLRENPTQGIEDVPTTLLGPRSLPDQAVDALLRVARREPDLRLRRRDEALLALLVYAGLRVQEACDVQVRDIDPAGGTVTIRSGKGGKARRIPLHPDAQRLMQRYLSEVRCPSGIPAIGSDQERELLLIGMQVTVAGLDRDQALAGHVRLYHLLHLVGSFPPAIIRCEPGHQNTRCSPADYGAGSSGSGTDARRRQARAESGACRTSQDTRKAA